MPVIEADQLAKLILPPDITAALLAAPKVIFPETREELLELAMGGEGQDHFEVRYDAKGESLLEATVLKCRNGININYPDPYMRRRDPDCMLVTGDLRSDKTRYEERFDTPFTDLKQDVLSWLGERDLIVLPFYPGGKKLKYKGLLICPANAAFFAAALGDLQERVALSQLPEQFEPSAIVYVAPPFRHTHCDGKQVVVHNIQGKMHEVFSLNLYPGPSAKKGIYGVLLAIGEREGWLTAHGSTVQVVTPYDNIVTFMHEGASGGGKSEMLEYPHRERDGRVFVGKNLVTNEERFLPLGQGCALRPVTDDMALCHPAQQQGVRLGVSDAEDAWFLRINHITGYGVDPNLEGLTVHPNKPLIFLNLHGVPNATCLIWEPIEDKPGKPCPNPRVIVPREEVPGVINEPVGVDVRSFGVRCPPCTREQPNYGILGFLQILPPALAWLWRLVAPRGFANPSITEDNAMSSEGVGSYWPFSTGRRVDQANLLLEQIRRTPGTRYILMPNQHVGAWKTGFVPQWVAREYLARRGGAKFRRDQITPARCPLLGFALNTIVVEGNQIARWFLQVDTQPEVGPDGYDAGAKILTDFFHRELKQYLDSNDLHPLGRNIIECCLHNTSVETYESLIPITGG